MIWARLWIRGGKLGKVQPSCNHSFPPAHSQSMPNTAPTLCQCTDWSEEFNQNQLLSYSCLLPPTHHRHVREGRSPLGYGPGKAHRTHFGSPGMTQAGQVLCSDTPAACHLSSVLRPKLTLWSASSSSLQHSQNYCSYMQLLHPLLPAS